MVFCIYSLDIICLCLCNFDDLVHIHSWPNLPQTSIASEVEAEDLAVTWLHGYVPLRVDQSMLVLQSRSICEHNPPTASNMNPQDQAWNDGYHQNCSSVCLGSTIKDNYIMKHSWTSLREDVQQVCTPGIKIDTPWNMVSS